MNFVDFFKAKNEENLPITFVFYYLIKTQFAGAVCNVTKKMSATEMLGHRNIRGLSAIDLHLRQWIC